MKASIWNLLAAAGALLVALLPSTLHAAYPERPVRLIVPFPAGNSLDIRARQIVARLPRAFGQHVVVDNRGGASGIIAMELAARDATQQKLSGA